MATETVAERYLGLCVGFGLVVFGLSLILSHRKRWQQQQDDPSLSSVQRRHLERRFRRRVQNSGLLAVSGLMIGVGDFVIPWQQYPGLFVIYWLAVLGLAVWIILLAMADIADSRLVTAAALRAIDQKHASLKTELSRLKSEVIPKSGTTSSQPQPGGSSEASSASDDCTQ